MNIYIGTNLLYIIIYLFNKSENKKIKNIKEKFKKTEQKKSFFCITNWWCA